MRLLSLTFSCTYTYTPCSPPLPFPFSSGCKSLYGSIGAGAARGGTGQTASTFVGQAPNACTPVGGFYVLYDESEENRMAEAASKDEDDDRGGRGRGKAKTGAEWR